MIDIDIKLLRSFAFVAADLNFSRAANRLGFSQATVSLRIKSLEDMLGFKLFNRGYHLVELTNRGKALLPRVQALLDQHDALLDQVRHGRITGHVQLGMAEDYSAPFLSRLLRIVDSAYPDIALDVTCAMSVRLQKLLEKRKLDLAIVTLPNPEVAATVLRRPKLFWVSSPDFRVDPEKPWPIAFYAEGCAFRAVAETALKRNGQSYRQVLTTASGEAIKSAVTSGTAITVMAEDTIPPGFRVLPAKTGLPRLPRSCIQLVERPDGLSKAAQQVKSSIVKVLS